ncbi:hypothetical protein TNCV_247501 [Trichonephila clavipes]|nr:hypothetical protein TNCV_247501 [Trichonephila clavipes]
MLVRIQQELLKTLRHLRDSSMADPLLRFVPCRARVGSAKRQMPSCHSAHHLELSVQDCRPHLPQGQHKVSNQLNAGPCGGILQLEVVQRAIEVSQYLCRSTPCIRLIVCFWRSSESLICVIMWVLNFISIRCFLLGLLFSMFLSVQKLAPDNVYGL